MIRHAFWTTALFLFFLEIFSLLPPRTAGSHEGPLFVTGGIHIPFQPRSNTSRFQSLIRAAKKSHLDFLVLANLNETLPASLAGSYEGVDVFTEMEAATPAGHSLLFYSHTDAAAYSAKKLKELAWHHFLGTDSQAGVFSVIAHPSSVVTPWERLDRAADGIELINLRSRLEHQAFEDPIGFGFTLLCWPFNPYLTALRLWGIHPRDFRGWDALVSVTPGFFGIVGTDDLSDWPVLGRLSTLIPQWDQTLGVASNVLFPTEPLASDFSERRKQIYATLRQGRSALLFQAIHPFPGNDWVMRCGSATFRSGDRDALLNPGCEFMIQTPSTLSANKRVVLLRDGEVVHEIPHASSQETLPIQEKGSYRVEIWVRQNTLFHALLDTEVPYLFYNPLYVR